MTTKITSAAKTWREQSVEPVGIGALMECAFDDTNPNYALITNPCPSPLYVGLSSQTSAGNAALVVPPFGQKILARPLPLNRIYIRCYDPETHAVNVASWEDEFSPNVISQTVESVKPISDTGDDADNVVVTNFPTSFGINNLPSIQRVQVENPTSFPSSVDVNNFPTSFNVGNFPTEQNVTVLNPYKPLELKESFSGTGNLSKTFSATMKSLWFKNDGATDITITISGTTFVIKAGEVFDERFAAFTTMDIVATESYRARVRG